MYVCVCVYSCKDQKRQIRIGVHQKHTTTYKRKHTCAIGVYVFCTVPTGGRQGRQKGNAIKEIVKYTGRFMARTLFSIALQYIACSRKSTECELVHRYNCIYFFILFFCTLIVLLIVYEIIYSVKLCSCSFFVFFFF